MKRFLRGLARLLGLFLFLALLLGFSGYLYLRASLPQGEGRIALEGLSAPVEVVRDGKGVVRIRAATLKDLFFAQGFVHAQERLWQMEFQRRVGQGRLSEILGRPRFPRTGSSAPGAFTGRPGRPTGGSTPRRRRRWTPTPPG